jgi:hypothetical protein
MTRKRVCVALFVAALAAGSSDVWAQCGPSPLVPPNSHAYGKSFEEWNVLYTQWAVATELGGKNLSNTVDGVRFLPNNVAHPGTYEFDVTMNPGTPFVAPPFPVFGEMYADGSQDDPDDPILGLIFDLTDIQVVLDGKMLMDSTAAELAKYQYGPVYFEHPVPYAEPYDHGGGVYSTAAVWTIGVGAVYHPLPVGRHTLVVSTDDHGMGLGSYQFTYHITVSPHQQ